MTIRVREFHPNDAADVVRLRRAAFAHLVNTPEGVVHQLRVAPKGEHFRHWVATCAGRVVGTANVALECDSAVPGQASAVVAVCPERRGRGVGSALLAEAERHAAGVGARTLYVWAADDPRSREFAERRGYRSGHSATALRLALPDASLAPALPPAGARLHTAADFTDDPRKLYEVDSAVSVDEPGDVVSASMSYPDWLAAHWRNPVLAHELTSVLVVDQEIVSFSLALTDGDHRYLSGMTGTRRGFRGRGLASVVKRDSLIRARAAGYTDAFTVNDTENAPMLAVNVRFGYRPFAEMTHYARSLAHG